MVTQSCSKQSESSATTPPDQVDAETSTTPTFTPLDEEKRAALPTADASYHLNLSPHTLRMWSSKGGPIEPIRLSRNRLAWRVSDIKKLLGVEV